MQREDLSPIYLTNFSVLWKSFLRHVFFTYTERRKCGCSFKVEFTFNMIDTLCAGIMPFWQCRMKVLCCLGRPLWRGWFPARDTAKLVSKAVCLYLVMNRKWDSLIHLSLIWVTFHISSHLGHVWRVFIIMKYLTCTDKCYFSIELQRFRVRRYAP